MSRQFTTEAEKALNKAAKFAIRMGQRIVGSEHLLFGLSAAPGVAAKVLKENGMDKERLDIEVREYCGMSDVVEMEPLRGETSPKLEELLLAAAEEAGTMQLKETGTEHMLLAKTRHVWHIRFCWRQVRPFRSFIQTLFSRPAVIWYRQKMN